MFVFDYLFLCSYGQAPRTLQMHKRFRLLLIYKVYNITITQGREIKKKIQNKTIPVFCLLLVHFVAIVAYV